MVSSIKFAFVFVLAVVGSTTYADDVQCSGGQLLDVISALETLGLNYWPLSAGVAQQFYIYNDNLKRFFQLSGGIVGDHVTIIGSIKPKTTGNLFELRRLEQGFITFAVDNETGVGNGAAAGANLQTGQWLTDPSHQYVVQQNGNSIQLINRGSGLCVSADGKNDSPLITAMCDVSDTKQMWNFCQNQISNSDADKVCWPRDDSRGLAQPTSTP